MLLFSAPALYAQGKVRVAAIGDSVTEGLGLAEGQSYPSVLQNLLGEGYEVGNFGHSGATVLRKGHNPYARTEKLTRALAFRADIAVIHLGLNDTDPRNFPHYRDEFIRDYLWLIDTLKATNPQLDIWVCTMTPVFTGHPRFSSSTFSWYHQIQELIAEVAKIRELPLIDFYGELHGRPDLFTDVPTLHPNAAGAARIAALVRQHLTGDFGGLRVAPVFTENMVVQRGKPFRVWGKANAGVTLKVTWEDKSQYTQSGKDGAWEVTFPAPDADFKPKSLRIERGNETLLFTNILVGDVWLASGQSNMEFPLRNAFRGDSLAAMAGNHIRLLQLDSRARTDNVAWDSLTLKKTNELDFFSGSWVENSAEAAATFSAVGYAFAHELSKNQNVPIGIIHLSVGGSPQMAWLPRGSLEADARFVQALHPWRKSDYLMAWCRERATENVSLMDSPFQQHPYAPAYIYEAGIKPLLPFSLKGVIWYQGESDAENPELYAQLFPYFVQEWRKQWQQDLPFFFVQLSSMERPSWPYFRDTQRRLLDQVPDAGMVVTSDIGEAHDVHPREKIMVGERLARWALNRVYGNKVTPSGPLFSGYARKNNTLEISFRYGEGLAPRDGEHLTGFAVQTADGRQNAVQAKIVKGKVVVETPPNARALVYGWDPVSRGNLVNAAHLPASTFQIILQ